MSQSEQIAVIMAQVYGLPQHSHKILDANLINDIAEAIASKLEQEGYVKKDRLDEINKITNIHEKMSDYTDKEYRSNFLSEVRLILTHAQAKDVIKLKEE